MADTTGLTGYPRPDGSTGCRNHVLVLPTVVCAGLVAEEIAAPATAEVADGLEDGGPRLCHRAASLC